MKKHMKKHISHKSLIDSRSLRVYNGTRYWVLFESEKYDFI